MPLFPRHPLRVQPFFGHRSHDRLVLSARALHARPPGFGQTSRLGAMRTLVEQFVSHEAANARVRLELRSATNVLVSHEGITDAEGYVHFDLTLDPAWDLPERPAWEMGRLHWGNRYGPQSAEAHILAPGHDSDLAVISDIDDTIIETGITGGLGGVLRNWKRIFAELPHERVPVPGAETFYEQLGGGQPQGADGHPAPRIPATRRPFFYVSSSPWNLFAYLVAYQRGQGLPLGPIKLRDWGLNQQTLGGASHGAHKQQAIDGILAMYPNLRFALIGDDTQGDLPAFAHAVRRNPGRIAGVFLRTVADEGFSPEEEHARSTLIDADVPLWMGPDYEAGDDFLRAIGVTPGGETEQIVRTLGKAGQGAAAR
jgi:phosphatidate phosphatase APP1